MLIHKFLSLFILFLAVFYSQLPTANSQLPTETLPPFLTVGTAWVDSVLNSLTPDERIAQLFMGPAYPNDSKNKEKIVKLIKENKIGGIIFFQGEPEKQAELTNYYQSLSKTPLLIAMDAEWGLGMRLKNTQKFPRQMTLGAVQDDSLIYQMGGEIARQCKRLGVHINFAPVIDINSNPLNPVIGNRSFGEDKYNVTRKGIAYMKGLQDNGIIACAKHFPGHGDTYTDSHLELPIITRTKEELDTMELYPFKELIKNGLASVMTAHLHIPAYDTTKNLATSLSQNVVMGLLKDELNFKGLIFTDALGMMAVTRYLKPAIIELKALLAGNDILLMSEDVPKAIEMIKKSIEKGQIKQEEIDNRCRKILFAKYWAQLNNYKPVDVQNIITDLNTPSADLLNRKLIENSLTLLINKDNIIPLKRLDTLKIASLVIGSKEITPFQEMLDNYTAITHFNFDKESTIEEILDIIFHLPDYKLIIVGIVNTNNKIEENFGVPQLAVNLLKILKSPTKGGAKIILTIFGNPYSLKIFDPAFDYLDGLLMAYEDNDISQSYSAQLIFGAISTKGKLPVTASKNFPLHSGITTKPLGRFKYTIPAEVNMNENTLKKIDFIVNKAIKDSVFPGCQVFVAKDNKVVFNKSYGYYTYEKIIPVKNTTLYDLASITKVASTTIAIMKLYDAGKISLDEKLKTYLPYLKGTDKGRIEIRELMAHQAGLKDWIDFYSPTIRDGGKYDKNIYSNKKDLKYSLRVADSLYIIPSFRDTILKIITHAPLEKKKEYKYSDLGMYYLQQIIENITNQPLDQYVYENFYKPMNLTTLRYKPKEHFSLSRIAPTENDTVFRHQIIWGDVHDEGAALMGGVAGHAGLFSNANDLVKLMQMLLQGGVYEDKRYINAETIKEFTRCQFPENKNRRALGFDKPGSVIGEKQSPACENASKNSFGHYGFTGTMVWVDPDYNLIYVFLSNRIHPSAKNNKITTLNIRTNIQKVIYEAMEEMK